jgi:hypothetical protein
VRRRGVLALIVVVAFAALAFVLARSGVLSPGLDAIDGAGAASRTPNAVETENETPPGDLRAVAGAATLAAHPRAKTPSPKESDDRITGRVVDVDGKPIADARVLDVPTSVTEAFDFDDVGREGLAVSDAVTDGVGRFTVAARGENPTHAIVARAPSGAIGYAIGVPVGRSGGSGDELIIVIDGGGAMRGTVTDRDGKPVSQATVRVDGVVDALHVRYEATTGLDGAYRIDGLPAAPRAGAYETTAFRALVEVRAEGFAPLLQSTAPYATATGDVVEHNYVLSKGSTIEGIVVDLETKAPIAGARVVLWSFEGSDEGDPGLMPHPSYAEMVRTSSYFVLGARTEHVRVRMPGAPRIVSEAKSDGRGRFRFERVPGLGFHEIYLADGSRRHSRDAFGYVTAVARGFSSASASAAALAAGELAVVELSMTPAASIEGRVLTPAGVDPTTVTIALVQNGIALHDVPRSLFPDEQAWNLNVHRDGRFRTDAFPASRESSEAVTLIARIADEETASEVSARTGALPATTDIVVRAGTVSIARDLLLAPEPSTLQGAGSAAIRVVDREGRPIWGARVALADRGYEVAGATDRTGLATVALERSANPVSLFVCRENFAARLVSTAFSEPVRDAISVVLRPERRVAGRVLKADGQPARGASVKVVNGRRPLDDAFHAHDRLGLPIVSAAGRSWLVDGDDLYPYFPARTDADGRFVVGDLPDGPYHVRASVFTEFAMDSAVSAEAVVSGVASDTTDLRIVLGPSEGPEPGRIRGVVHDAATGAPPHDLRVELRLADGDDLRAGTADGRPLGFPAGRSLETALAGPGRFDFGGVPAGTHRLHVASEGYAPRSLDVVVTSGAATDVPTIDLVRGVVVHGRARWAGGGFGAGFFIVALPVVTKEPFEGLAERTAALGDDGRFELAGLSPGRWRMHAKGPTSSSLAPSDRFVLVVPDGASEVEWEGTMATTGSLSVGSDDLRLPNRPWDGKTTEEQRRFGLGCEVEVINERGDVVAAQKGGFYRDEMFSVSSLGLPLGSYTVRTRVPGEPNKEERVTVAAEKAAQVTFGERPPGATGTPGVGKCG